MNESRQNILLQSRSLHHQLWHLTKADQNQCSFSSDTVISVFKHKLEFVDFTPLCRWSSLRPVSLLCYFLLLNMRQCLFVPVCPDFCLNKWISISDKNISDNSYHQSWHYRQRRHSRPSY